MKLKISAITILGLLALSAVLVGCSGQGGATQTGELPSDLDKELRDGYAALSAHDVDQLISSVTEDVEMMSVNGSKMNRGKEEHRAYLENLFSSVPDFKMELISFFGSGNQTCETWTMSGTPAGTMKNGAPATGKSYSIRGVTIREFRDGKTSRITNYYDSGLLMQQLGLLPLSSPEKQPVSITQSK
jgi:steroid delta-isomerase-like uncharacterized protein